MELDTLPDASFLPNGCTACHTHAGPFVVIRDLAFIDVPTAEGLATVRGPIAFCVGNEERGEIGCAQQIGLAAGLSPRSYVTSLEGSVTAMGHTIDAKNEELDRRDTELEEAKASQIRVVPVDALLDELAKATA